MQVYENDGNGWHRTASLTATPVLVLFMVCCVSKNGFVHHSTKVPLMSPVKVPVLHGFYRKPEGRKVDPPSYRRHALAVHQKEHVRQSPTTHCSFGFHGFGIGWAVSGRAKRRARCFALCSKLALNTVQSSLPGARRHSPACKTRRHFLPSALANWPRKYS
jgi:hypothetical protein